jgi:Formiminotransferase domain, N-terminal subdomain
LISEIKMMGHGLAPDSTIVACNVYVSEGRSKDILSRLLECAVSRGGPSCCRLVHVFCDARYNRSSFHFVGSTLGIIAVVAPFCWEAWTTLERKARMTVNTDTSNSSSSSSSSPSSFHHLRSRSDHPTVGYVDHVAVLPLTKNIGTIHVNHRRLQGSDEEANVTGMTAMKIGQYLEARNQSREQVQVLYYGSACPNWTPLATVRRNQTNFFQQQQQQQQQHQQQSTTVTTPMTSTAIESPPPSVTIGAPDMFVENYNIRLRCDRATARTLTKRLRTSLSIEALTLAYGTGGGGGGDSSSCDDDTTDTSVYEVACNLTNAVTTVDDIEREVAAWRAELRHAALVLAADPAVDILLQYRVGTTALQCQQIWAAPERDYERHIAALRGSVLEHESL